MAWDIHGNILEKGHCEVHPWVHQEYPCSICYDESRKQQERKNQEIRERQQYEQSLLQEKTYTKEEVIQKIKDFESALDNKAVLLKESLDKHGCIHGCIDIEKWCEQNIK